jgi:hypothetical protein
MFHVYYGVPRNAEQLADYLQVQFGGPVHRIPRLLQPCSNVWLDQEMHCIHIYCLLYWSVQIIFLNFFLRMLPSRSATDFLIALLFSLFAAIFTRINGKRRNLGTHSTWQAARLLLTRFRGIQYTNSVTRIVDGHDLRGRSLHCHRSRFCYHPNFICHPLLSFRWS